MNDNTRGNRYPLTNPQKRIWYIENIYSNPSMWNIGGAIKVKGSLDLDLAEKAINILVKKNEAFRLNFININGDMYQYVKEYEKVPVDRYVFNSDGEFNTWADNDYKTGFTIGKEDLYYFALCNVNESEAYIYLKMHHIISDGWSFAVIVQAVCDIYHGLVKGIEVNELVESSYIEFIKGEENYINSNRFKKDMEYWNDKFNILPELLYDEKGTDVKGTRKVYEIDKNLSKKIQDFIKDINCSLNTFFIAAYLIYLYKMLDQKSSVIGNPTFNRSNRKERKTVGMFTSTMPFKFEVDKERSIKELISEVNSELFKCFKHQKYPYNLLVQDLKLNKLGYDSLFNVCINYYNGDFNVLLNDNPVEVVDFFNGYQAYPLQIVVKEWSKGGEIELAFDYKVNEFSEESIELIYGYMIRIINNMLKDSDEKIDNIKLVSEEELNNLQININSAESWYPQNKTICQLFEEQAARTADNIALSFNNINLTYNELNGKANQLARKLQEKGIQRESTVAVMATHSFEMVIAILAIIKAGGAYVPIDGNYPRERIKYMIEDSGVSLILTNYDSSHQVPFSGEYININNTQLYTGDKSNLECISLAKDMVYMIYTSGSTGKPKGVMIEHRGLVNYTWWARKMYIRSDEEVFALYSSLSFDLTVTSIFTPLINGNRVELYYDDGSEFILYKILKENKVNIIKLTPAHLSLLKDMDNKNSSVRRFIVGGENLKVSLASAVYESFEGNVEIFNEYGPTETVVGCMIYKYNYLKDKGRSVPIGVPGDNVQIYILDRDYNIVPYGKIGELYVSGDGVARGYLNREELTAERFLPNPFISGSIMYKTGDTAKYQKDGTIEYMGRVDNQVKIRGHRIELEEIEKHILTMKNVTEAVVIDREDNKGEKKLYAYIVSTNEMTSEDIKKSLIEALPNYMIPTYVTFIDKIPLTPNGKVNVKFLPEVKNISSSKGERVEPRNEIEEKIVNIVKEVLAIEEISINDNFYELGGDSIKAIQIATKLNNFGMTIKVKDILTCSAIGEMAAALSIDEDVQASQGCCEGKAGNTPITSWFFEEGFKNYNHWNQSVLLKLDDNISTEMIVNSLNELIRHHDSLRFNFYRSTGELYYNNEHLNGDIWIQEFDLSELPSNEQKLQLKLMGEKFKSSFDIEKDLLFKACIFNLGQGERRLLITAHHLVVDGVSWRIILEDLNDMLQHQLREEEHSLPKKTHSVKEWVKALEEYSKVISIEEQQYWSKVIENKIAFPVDFYTEEDNLENISTLEAELSIEDTEKLLSEANTAYGTESNEILIIALALAMSKFIKGNEISLELEGHGREDISTKVDITRTVGWFTSMYPINLNIEGDDLNTKIKSIKERIRGVPNKGFDFGVLKYIRKTIKDHNRYVRFNYLGEFDNTFSKAVFENSYEESGLEQGRENHLTSLVEVVSMIIGKKLRISMTFSNKRYKEETVNSLLNDYLIQLHELINYCCNKNGKEFTPSDFDAVELSQEDLDSLFD